MRSNNGRAEAAQLYATAHAAQYNAKDLSEALELHTSLMAAHPNTQEAGYSRAQIQNIVKNVVPKQVLLEDQVGLALAYLVVEGPPDVEAAPVVPLAPEPTS